MGYNLEILPEAYRDLSDATDYYAKISWKVVNNFNKKIDEAFLRIQTNPHYQKRYGNVQALPVNNFPYMILYELIGNNIYILSVFCTHQNPEKYP